MQFSIILTSVLLVAVMCCYGETIQQRDVCTERAYDGFVGTEKKTIVDKSVCKQGILWTEKGCDYFRAVTFCHLNGMTMPQYDKPDELAILAKFAAQNSGTKIWLYDPANFSLCRYIQSNMNGELITGYVECDTEEYHEEIRVVCIQELNTIKITCTNKEL